MVTAAGSTARAGRKPILPAAGQKQSGFSPGEASFLTRPQENNGLPLVYNIFIIGNASR
jgi:hypothetical protein